MAHKRKTPFKTREEWLQAFTKAARPIFKKEAGLDVPEVRVSIGFTSTGARGKAIGQCWQGEASTDNTVVIFIDPHSRIDPCCRETWPQETFC